MEKVIALLLIHLLISACGSAGSTESIPDEKSSLELFLYDRESISFNRLANPDSNVAFAIENLNLNRSAINEIIYTTISYSNTNLPSINVLLTSRIPNRSLIIYNHGHDGLPTNNQSWAIDFINTALQSGYSVLITSMPLVGLNAPNPALEYYMIPKGDQKFTTIGKNLLQWPIVHQIYQAINGPGNFMHFFVDGSVLPAHFLGPNDKPRSYFVNGVQGLIRFNSVHYVGISGGGFSGLVSCALYSYRSCTLIAGFLPLKYKITDLKNWGDSEQYADGFFHKFSYEELIKIASQKSLKMTYIYNSDDECCFSEPAVSAFKRDYPHLGMVCKSQPSDGLI